MNEVEKMYKNAGIKPDCTYLFLVDGNGKNEAARTMSIGSKADLKRLIVDCGVKGKVIKSTNTLKPFYPSFTAEKQIAILKFCLKWGQVHLLRGIDDGYRIENCCYRHGYQPTIADAIANYINEKWEKLTPEKRKEIKNILK